MNDNIRKRALALLGCEFRLPESYNWFELYDDTLRIDGEFTLDELKAIVQAWEEIEKERRENDRRPHNI